MFYEQCLAKLSEEFGAKKLSQIAPFHLEAYKSRRKEEAPVRLNRELATLKAMYNRLGMGKKGLKKYDGANPVVDVEALEESEGRLRVLSRDEEARLLASARDPLRTLLLVGLYGGLRVKSEGLTLTWGSIDLGRRSLTVAAAYAKANRTRNVPMNSALVEAFRNLKERTVKTGPDDPGVRESQRRTPPFVPHGLHHGEKGRGAQRRRDAPRTETHLREPFGRGRGRPGHRPAAWRMGRARDGPALRAPEPGTPTLGGREAHARGGPRHE